MLIFHHTHSTLHEWDGMGLRMGNGICPSFFASSRGRVSVGVSKKIFTQILLSNCGTKLVGVSRPLPSPCTYSRPSLINIHSFLYTIWRGNHVLLWEGYWEHVRIPAICIAWLPACECSVSLSVELRCKDVNYPHWLNPQAAAPYSSAIPVGPSMLVPWSPRLKILHYSLAKTWAASWKPTAFLSTINIPKHDRHISTCTCTLCEQIPHSQPHANVLGTH